MKVLVAYELFGKKKISWANGETKKKKCITRTPILSKIQIWENEKKIVKPNNFLNFLIY